MELEEQNSDVQNNDDTKFLMLALRKDLQLQVHWQISWSIWDIVEKTTQILKAALKWREIYGILNVLANTTILQ
jgi:hypothetical protein